MDNYSLFFLNNLFNKQLLENLLTKTGSTADVKVVEKAVNQSAADTVWKSLV